MTCPLQFDVMKVRPIGLVYNLNGASNPDILRGSRTCVPDLPKRRCAIDPGDSGFD